MNNQYQIDSLDKKILTLLNENSRMPYLEIAREVGVTGAAIHQRMQKLKDSGFVKGTKLLINPKAIGYHTCAFIGLSVNLTGNDTHEKVFERIMKIPEIVECHHITGQHSLLLKIYAKSNEHLKDVIVKHIQSISAITATETLISLEEGFERELPIV